METERIILLLETIERRLATIESTLAKLERTERRREERRNQYEQKRKAEQEASRNTTADYICIAMNEGPRIKRGDLYRRICDMFRKDGKQPPRKCDILRAARAAGYTERKTNGEYYFFR